jgi:methylenetetrahydrofolate dehydrogenase (NADP+)/methenyltetrahydrofolate cyclohydrolase
MSAVILDGKQTAKTITNEVRRDVDRLRSAYDLVPGLATVLVGDDPASHYYVKSKQKRCAEVGIQSLGYELSTEATQEEITELLESLNSRKDVHGILVQLPLPRHVNEEQILNTITLAKDVDGFHPVNVGRLAMKGRAPLFVPATPAGCIELLDRYQVEIDGKEAVVLGRSNIVGLPLAMLLLKRNATVTMCHSHTRDLAATCRRADILVAAVGQPGIVRSNWVKPGAAVIDVGINRVDDPSAKRGYRIIGDVDFDGVVERAGYVTPVPGGVGPMTIAMLLRNTLTAAKRSLPEDRKARC